MNGVLVVEFLAFLQRNAVRAARNAQAQHEFRINTFHDPKRLGEKNNVAAINHWFLFREEQYLMAGYVFINETRVAFEGGQLDVPPLEGSRVHLPKARLWKRGLIDELIAAFNHDADSLRFLTPENIVELDTARTAMANGVKLRSPQLEALKLVVTHT